MARAIRRVLAAGLISLVGIGAVHATTASHPQASTVPSGGGPLSSVSYAD